MEFLAGFYGRLGNREKYNKYKELCIKKFPNSKLVQNDEFTAFRMEKNLKVKEAKLNDFIEKFPQSKLITNMFYILINDLSKKKEYLKAENLIKSYPKYADAEMYNSVAWSMYTSGAISPMAINLAATGVKLAREEVKAPKTEKPVYLTDKQWKESKERSLGYVLDTYGSLLRKSGENEKALSACKEAVSLTKEKQSDLNENYIECLLSSGYKEQAKKSLEKFVSSGNYNQKMKDELKSLFVELGGSKKELTGYMQKIEGAAKSKLVEKIKKELTESPAPKFTLSDLKGKNVSLDDFKGKTVILDFWATWCGPCKKSFPAMKMAVEKFKNNPNVKFLFVNTWERVKDKKQNAADFIKKNNYPFEVLIDKENKVVADYNVPGIPTKFIIDKNGNIRFKSVGFSGKDDELVEELSTVIALVK
ncbi:thiol-disulfide oxidoreductase ResA [bacterium BMS3Abin04]|nr:thiol-disulfide oxidoreductase ResA [bacterium BMS3Abin04]